MRTCTLRPGWSCNQAQYAALVGPYRLPGPDGTSLRSSTTGELLGFGAVPTLANVSCWCINAAGTFTSSALDCAPFACPFPARCVDATAAPRNGTACLLGSEGSSCAVCSKRFYRWRDDCRACPDNRGVVIALLVVVSGTCDVCVVCWGHKAWIHNEQGADGGHLH
jgi:hypothetical protein